MSYIDWLDDRMNCGVTQLGTKAANLARLRCCGLPVPDGFCITTEAYCMLARALAPAIAGLLDDSEESNLSATFATGEAIQRLIRRHGWLPQLRDEIETAYSSLAELAGPAVAVRSSAIAEDTATASFAGVYESFLDIAGIDAVLSAVRDCWASLWSAHALWYRRMCGWNKGDMAMAVLVQTMVKADWAGVLFTANPVTGRRDEVLIEAVMGTGKRLVSGEVSGLKYAIHRKGTALEISDSEGDMGMPREAIRELALLGLSVEECFGTPQDIEWAWADKHAFILQTRPFISAVHE